MRISRCFEERSIQRERCRNNPNFCDTRSSTVSGFQHKNRYVLSSSRRNWMDYLQKNKAKDRKTMIAILSTTNAMPIYAVPQVARPPPEIFTVKARPAYGNVDREIELQLTNSKIIGNGSFGTVFMAELCATNETVAIKKVCIDARYKNRELGIMKRLQHPNIVRLMYFYYERTVKDEEMLYMMMEFMPKTLHQVLREHTKNQTFLSSFHTKLYTFQLLRALAFIHTDNLVHRDIKPQNLLVDHEIGVLKVCDFGSAKFLEKDRENVSYICSRYYRAPELLLCCNNYGVNIDVWSAGAVLCEFFHDTPLFLGTSSAGVLITIASILGKPQIDDIPQKRPTISLSQLPDLPGIGIAKVLNRRPSGNALQVIQGFLKYSPSQRMDPLEALALPYFDDLRNPSAKLPNGAPLPPIFEWYEKEVVNKSDILRKIFPSRKESVATIEVPAITIEPLDVEPKLSDENAIGEPRSKQKKTKKLFSLN
ncbi:unnamed protein product [Caenorhabditis auriculariae]|uniref:Protein kinase domain-containing protein n=1 Tax=Caenorhabditis auriculariae TaxID=2777116 RepID=A0A8S1GWU6_9PELO|nr:unnamed protein product [Caenorhabditis auriculariae]